MITLEQALAEPPPPPPLIHYPESDGQPMGDNDEQRNWMVKIIENLKVRFFDRPDVYVTGNLFWYPVEGNNRIVQAPDAMVVFGRPPGPNSSISSASETKNAPAPSAWQKNCAISALSVWLCRSGRFLSADDQFEELMRRAGLGR